jgi:hypothetical protein
LSQTFVPTADPLPPVAEISMLLPLGVTVIFEPAVIERTPVNEFRLVTPLPPAATHFICEPVLEST